MYRTFPATVQSHFHKRLIGIFTISEKHARFPPQSIHLSNANNPIARSISRNFFFRGFFFGFHTPIGEWKSENRPKLRHPAPTEGKKGNRGLRSQPSPKRGRAYGRADVKKV